MKITLDIPDYDGDSLDVVWENGSKYAKHGEKMFRPLVKAVQLLL